MQANPMPSYRGGRLDTFALPMLPPAYQATAPKRGTMLPDKVAYVTGGGLVPHIPADPDIPAPVTAAIAGGGGGRKLPNGLSLRSDAMARLIVRGVQGVSAYRACFPASGEAVRDATRASRIVRAPRFAAALLAYRQAMEAEQSQATFGMRDFVLSRLTHEAQTAPEASARIKALDLLGKSEALWTTVHRTERTIGASDLASLKAQLEQRVRHALTRLGQGRIMSIMENQGLETAEPGQPGPYPPVDPLEGDGTPSGSGDTNPHGPLLQTASHPPVFSGGPVEMHPGDISLGDISVDNLPGGGPPRELLLADLGL